MAIAAEHSEVLAPQPRPSTARRRRERRSAAGTAQRPAEAGSGPRGQRAEPYRMPEQAKRWLHAVEPPLREVRPHDKDGVREVEKWFVEYARTRDPRVRERIITVYLGLADRIADRYRSARSLPAEDLRQIARLALIRAVDRYDPDRPNSFVPFAVATVEGEIKRQLRDTSWRLHVPRGLKELALRVCRASDELPQRLGHMPSTDDLAEALDADPATVREAIEVAQSWSMPSLDQPVGETESAVLGELVADPALVEDRVDAIALRRLLRALPAREREIVRLRYVEELTQDEIGARVGISQMHVSRLLRRTLSQLREELVPAG